jgi:PAS domain-containing protein
VELKELSSEEDRAQILLHDLAEKIALLPGEYQDLLTPDIIKLSNQIAVFSLDRTKYTAVNQDITERKQTEERLTYQAQLLDMVHDAIIATDHQMMITYWNQAAERLYGWTSQEALGQNATQLLRSGLAGSEREQVLQQA